MNNIIEEGGGGMDDKKHIIVYRGVSWWTIAYAHEGKRNKKYYTGITKMLTNLEKILLREYYDRGCGDFPKVTYCDFAEGLKFELVDTYSHPESILCKFVEKMHK